MSSLKLYSLLSEEEKERNHDDYVDLVRTEHQRIISTWATENEDFLLTFPGRFVEEKELTDHISGMEDAHMQASDYAVEVLGVHGDHASRVQMQYAHTYGRICHSTHNLGMRLLELQPARDYEQTRAGISAVASVGAGMSMLYAHASETHLVMAMGLAGIGTYVVPHLFSRHSMRRMIKQEFKGSMDLIERESFLGLSATLNL